MSQLSSTLELGLDAERLLSPHPRRALHPAAHDSAEKVSTSLLDVKHTRRQYDSHYSSNLPGIEGSIVAQVANDIDKGCKDMHSLLEKIPNSGMLKPFLRFPFISQGGGGGREGLRMKLTVFVSEASANFCDGPLSLQAATSAYPSETFEAHSPLRSQGKFASALFITRLMIPISNIIYRILLPQLPFVTLLAVQAYSS